MLRTCCQKSFCLEQLLKAFPGQFVVKVVSVGSVVRSGIETDAAVEYSSS